MQNQPEQAQRLAAEVLTVNPGDAPALNLMGLALKAQKQYKKAAQQYQAAIKADPKYAQAYYNQGALYATELNDKTRAYIAFKKFLALEPQGPRADKVRQWIRSNGG